MNTYERAIKRGRWLLCRKRWLPTAVGLCSVAALLASTPFRIVHDRLWLLILCVAIAVAGIVLRAVSNAPTAARRACGEQDPATLPDLIEVGGVFSVIRFPAMTANLLLIASVVLYTGIFWYLIAAAMACYVGVYCIVLAQEHSLQSRWGELFIQWCRTTYAIIPLLINWQPWTIRIRYAQLILAQSRTIFAMTVCFCLIDLAKHWVVEFELRISIPWLVALGSALVLSLASRGLRRK